MAMYRDTNIMPTALNTQHNNNMYYCVPCVAIRRLVKK